MHNNSIDNSYFGSTRNSATYNTSIYDLSHFPSYSQCYHSCFSSRSVNSCLQKKQWYEDTVHDTWLYFTSSYRVFVSFPCNRKYRGCNNPNSRHRTITHYPFGNADFVWPRCIEGD